jgi:hypothetical protein
MVLNRGMSKSPFIRQKKPSIYRKTRSTWRSPLRPGSRVRKPHGGRWRGSLDAATPPNRAEDSQVRQESAAGRRSPTSSSTTRAEDRPGVLGGEKDRWGLADVDTPRLTFLLLHWLANGGPSYSTGSRTEVEKQEAVMRVNERGST